MMDAVKFTRAAMRMCNDYYSKCWSCPAGDDTSCKLDRSYSAISAEEKVAIVEQWAERHPAKTRQSVFLEQYPEARIDKATGVLTICPAELTKECRDDRGACGAYSVETCVCEPCRRDFWLAEVE
jgi:hypothetical protein